MLRRVKIPEPGWPGEFRPLSIPTVADRVVMTAAKLVLEPVFEAQFTEASYGFRPRRSAIDACEAVRVSVNQWRGKYYLQRWPSARVTRVLRDKVRAATVISKAERPLSAVVADLNPVLRGWGAYFRNGNSGRKFNAVDGYVHERLAILASRKHGLRGRNWTTRFTYGWITRLRVYRLTGTVRRATAHASR
ncbi:group II intron maturase-specific domain-containing protein [Streptomyces sp. NPDC090442]|uniref:group II intron maturase-specific domain-containing protein n=1 Tax=Streptomyces sp. NPDC090442 TaxID=3365962 RepID=UPI003821A80F